MGSDTDVEVQTQSAARLAKALLATGLVDSAALQQAQAAHAGNGKGLIFNLVALGLVDEAALLRALGEQFGLFVMDLSRLDLALRPDFEFRPGFLRRHHFLPLLRSGIELTVGISDPCETQALDELAVITGTAIRPVLVSPLQLDALIETEEAAAQDATGELEDAAPEELPRSSGAPPSPAPAAVPPGPIVMRDPGVPKQRDMSRDIDGGTGVEVGYELVPVYYATDRARADGKAAQTEYFSGRRSKTSELQYGRCMVSIPKDHRIGKVERPSWLKLQFREDPEKHVVILKFVEFESAAFFNEMRAYLAGLSEPGVLVFVHGFNVGFAEAVRRTGQIAYDLKFNGPAVSYSWPSEAAVLDYPTDEGNARWSKTHFKQFITDLRTQLNAPYIHLIAHSMGSRVVAEALGAAQEDDRWAQVIFAAPDIDAAVFKELTGHFRGNVQRITLYASSNDKALKLSRKLHGGYPRAGEIIEGVHVFDGVDTVDASLVDTGLLGHSYYGDNRSVVSDIFQLLTRNEDPDQRFGMQPGKNAQGRPYWAFRP